MTRAESMMFLCMFGGYIVGVLWMAISREIFDRQRSERIAKHIAENSRETP